MVSYCDAGYFSINFFPLQFSVDNRWAARDAHSAAHSDWLPLYLDYRKGVFFYFLSILLLNCQKLAFFPTFHLSRITVRHNLFPIHEISACCPVIDEAAENKTWEFERTNHLIQWAPTKKTS